MEFDTSRVADHVQPDRLADTIKGLIDVPSPIGQEQACAEWLVDVFEDMGLATELQVVEEGRANAVGRLRGQGGGASCMLLGHLDTTWSGQEEHVRGRGAGYQPRAYQDGDWIYGMGAYNMKSGLAAAVEAVHALIDSGMECSGEVILAGVCGETGNVQVGRFQGASYRGAGVGARHLVTNGVVADLCVIPEPTNSRISHVSGGFLLLEVLVRGYASSTYIRSATGLDVRRHANALEKVQTLMDYISEWGLGYTEANRYDGEVAAQVEVLAVESGLPYRPSKQAALGRFTVEVGIMPGKDPLDAIGEVQELLREGAVKDPELEAELHVIATVPGAEVPVEEYVVTGLREAHKEEYGEDAIIGWDSWLADTTHLTRYGVPAVCYGPAGRMREGGAGYYAKEGEQCYLPDMVAGTRALARFVASTCNKNRDDLKRPTLSDRGTIVL